MSHAIVLLVFFAASPANPGLEGAPAGVAATGGPSVATSSSTRGPRLLLSVGASALGGAAAMTGLLYAAGAFAEAPGLCGFDGSGACAAAVVLLGMGGVLFASAGPAVLLGQGLGSYADLPAALRGAALGVAITASVLFVSLLTASPPELAQTMESRHPTFPLGLVVAAAIPGVFAAMNHERHLAIDEAQRSLEVAVAPLSGGGALAVRGWF